MSTPKTLGRPAGRRVGSSPPRLGSPPPLGFFDLLEQREVEQVFGSRGRALVADELGSTKETHDVVPVLGADAATPGAGEVDARDAGHDVDAERFAAERRHAIAL